MTFHTCPRCSNEVVSKVDGMCPSCGCNMKEASPVEREVARLTRPRLVLCTVIFIAGILFSVVTVLAAFSVTGRIYVILALPASIGGAIFVHSLYLQSGSGQAEAQSKVRSQYIACPKCGRMNGAQAIICPRCETRLRN